MSPRRSKRTRMTATSFSYCEDDDADDTYPSDSDDESDLFGNLLGLVMQNMMRRVSGGRRRTRQPAKKTPKRRRTATHGPCCGQEHCAANMFGRQNRPAAAFSSAGPSRSSGAKKSSHKRSVPKPTVTLNLDSDDDTKITDGQEKDMTSRIDSFFKHLESSDDDYEKKLKNDDKSGVTPSVKDSNFYSISDDDDDVKISSSCEGSFSKPGTSGINTSTLNTSTTSTKANQEAKEDLFAFVDNIINSDDVKLEEAKPKSGQVKTLEELKKKTEEILGSVSTLIDEMNPKKKNEEAKPVDEPPEDPSCPICFEPFSETLQRMVTMCGHMFCEPCIKEVAKTTKHCPTCRKAVNSKKYHAIYL